MIWGHNSDIHTQKAANDQQGVAHVRPRVANVGVFNVRDRLIAMLTHGHDVSDHLCRVVLVGEAIVDGNAGIFSQRFDALLRRAAILNGVIHAAKHARRVLE